MNAAARSFRPRKAAKAAPKPYAAVLQKAIQAHQSGDLDTAERLYGDVLRHAGGAARCAAFPGRALPPARPQRRGGDADRLGIEDHPAASRRAQQPGQRAQGMRPAGRRRALLSARAGMRPRPLPGAEQPGGGAGSAGAAGRGVRGVYPPAAAGADLRARPLPARPVPAHPRTARGAPGAVGRMLPAGVSATTNAMCVRSRAWVSRCTCWVGTTRRPRSIATGWCASRTIRYRATCWPPAVPPTAPPRAADDYVRDVFDGFADSFDEQLLNNLGYRAPEVLVAALTEVLPAAARRARRARCRLRHGAVRAADPRRTRGGWSAWICPAAWSTRRARVAATTRWRWPSSPPGCRPIRATFDLVISADTLVYFGELVPVLGAPMRRCDPAAGSASRWRRSRATAIAPNSASSGRYRHSRAYVERVLAASGFGRHHDPRRHACAARRASRCSAGWFARGAHRSTAAPDGGRPSENPQMAHAITVTSDIDSSLLFVRMSASEALGRLFSYDLHLLSESATVDLRKLLGTPMTVTLKTDDGLTRHFNGIVCRAAQTGFETISKVRYTAYRMTAGAQALAAFAARWTAASTPRWTCRRSSSRCLAKSATPTSS